MPKFVAIILVIIIIYVGFYLGFKSERSLETNLKNKNMKISSPDFSNNKFIPSDFTCDGKNINPEIRIENIPAGAKSMILIVDDPDAPNGTWTHWTLWNIPPETKIIQRGILPEGTIEGKTDFGGNGWGGPCPPSGSSHRYFFRIFALDKKLELKEGAERKELEKAMEGHILEKAEFFGLYKR